MSFSVAAINRLLALLAAIGLLVTGVTTLGWYANVHWFRERVESIDQQWFKNAPASSWWAWALIGIVVVAALIGFYVLSVNTRRRRLTTWTLPHSDRRGALISNLSKVADAAADNLTHIDVIESATAKAVNDRNTPTLRVEIGVSPDADLDEVIAATRAATDEIYATIGEAKDVALIYELTVQAPQSARAR